MFLIRLSIRRPVGLLMFYFGLIFFGFISLRHLAIDLLPDMALPRLSVITKIPGAAPEEVENFITAPLEAVLSSLPGLRRLESVSKEGFSFLSLEFNWGTNMDLAFLHTRERLDSIRSSLPEETEDPTIFTIDPQSQPIMIVAIMARGNLFEIKELAEELIKPRLEQIEGIGSAEIVGGLEREIRVEVDPYLLTLYGLTIDEIASRLDAFNRNLQGGIIRKGQFKYALRVVSEFGNLEEIASIPLKIKIPQGIIRLRDVARVVDSFKERQGAVSLNGQETVALLLRKEAGTNTVKVTRSARKEMEEIEREYPEIRFFVVSEEARTIEESMKSVEKEIVLGSLLAFLVFYLFLQDLGMSLIIFGVIFTSVIATFNLLFIRSITLNIMSLGGLALGVGMLDDCAIVVTENIYRHRNLGRSWLEAAISGASEITLALTASIFTSIAVFLPVIYIQGVAGRLFRDQALTVTFSLLTSLFVSLTLIPMLASRPWAREKKSVREAGRKKWFSSHSLPSFNVSKGALLPFLLIRWLIFLILSSLMVPFQIIFFLCFHFLKRCLILISRPLRIFLFRLFHHFNQAYGYFLNFYLNFLIRSLNHKGRVALISSLAFLAIILVAFHLPRELLPQPEAKAAEIRIRTPVEYSFEETLTVVQSLERKLRNDPAIRMVFSQTGLISGLEAFSPEISQNSARILFKVRQVNDIDRVIERLRGWMTSLPELNFSIQKEQSILAQWLGPGYSELDLHLYGDDLEILRGEAFKLAEKLKSFSGIASAHISYEEGKPELVLKLKKEILEAKNLSPADVSNFIVQAVRGKAATSYRELNKSYDIIIKAEKTTARDIDSLLNFSFPSPSGPIPLRHLVTYQLRRGPSEIRRENQQKMMEIRLGLKGNRPSQILPEIEKMAAEINLGGKIRLGFGKEAEEMKFSFRSLFMALILSVILVYMILAAQFESLLHPLLIMFSVPMGLSGSFLALSFTGQTINLLSLIGLVVTVGIVVNNAIVEIDIINQLRRQGLELREAIVSGCRLRVRPILMSSLSTVFGLMPLSLGLGGGSDLEKPLGVAISGGLLMSTFLTLVLIPCLYEAVEKRKEKKKG